MIVQKNFTSDHYCWHNGSLLTAHPRLQAPLVLFKLIVRVGPDPQLSPLSATCWGAVTFWQCCGNMMRTSCLRDLSSVSHSQFGVFVCKCVCVCVCETISSQHNGGSLRFMGYLLSEGPFVTDGPNHRYSIIALTFTAIWGLESNSDLSPGRV